MTETRVWKCSAASHLPWVLMAEKHVASPVSTGGAGYEFEANVGAVFLSALLTGTAPRVQSGGRTVALEFQRTADGLALDDLLVRVETAAGLATLAFQIKRSLRPSVVHEVVAACWRTFDHAEFNRNNDRMVIACGEHSPRITDWQYVCDAASMHAASAARRFIALFTGRGTSNKAQRELIRVVRDAGAGVRGSEPSAEEMLSFFRRVTVLPFDVSPTTSRDRAAAVERLSHTLPEDAADDTGRLFEELVQLARSAITKGGSFDRSTLRALLRKAGWPIADVDRAVDEQRVLRYFERLDGVTRRILDARVGYIAQQLVTLDGERRADALSVLEEWLVGDSGIFLLLGDYGTGKSSTLVAFAAELATRWKKSRSGPLPIFVPLEQWTRDESLQQYVTRTIAEQGGDWRTLSAASEPVLFLDGFDEIRDAVSESDLARRFDSIGEMCAGYGVRIVLTSRTHFFRSDDDLQFIAVTPGSRVGGVGADIRVMQDFTPENVQEFVKKYAGAQASRLRRLLSRAPSELCRRPLILSMLVSVLPKFEKTEEITLENIFARYTQLWFRRQAGRGVLGRQMRERFCLAFAALLDERGARSATAGDVDALLVSLGADRQHLPIQAASADVRTVALIVRDSVGSYSFSHRSIGDYFLALGIMDELQPLAGNAASLDATRVARAGVSDLCKLFVRSLLLRRPLALASGLAAACATTRNETLATNLAPMLVTGDDARSAAILGAAKVAELDHRAGRHYVWALGEIGATAKARSLRSVAVDMLESVIEQASDDFVLWNAAFALNKCRDDIDPLRTLFDRMGEVRRWSRADIIDRLDQRRSAVAVAWQVENGHAMSGLLDDLTAVALDAKRDVETRYNAVWSLGQVIRSGRASVAARRRAHAAIRNTILRESVNYMQSNLAEVLGMFGDDGDAMVFDALLRGDDVYFRTKIHAVDALRRMESHRAKAVLRDIASLQIDPAVRLAINRKPTSEPPSE